MRENKPYRDCEIPGRQYRLFYLEEPLEFVIERDFIEVSRKTLGCIGLYPSGIKDIRPLKAELSIKSNAILVDNIPLEEEISKLIDLLQKNQERCRKLQEELETQHTKHTTAERKLRGYEDWVLGQIAPILKNHLSLEAFESAMEEEEEGKYD